jgi:hypothetical protein
MDNYASILGGGVPGSENWGGGLNQAMPGIKAKANTQNALQKLAMMQSNQRLFENKSEAELGQQQIENQLQEMQAGPLDYLNAGAGAYGMLKSMGKQKRYGGTTMGNPQTFGLTPNNAWQGADYQ